MSTASRAKKNTASSGGRAVGQNFRTLATQAFAERGYASSSLRDIAEQAGVTAAALYYHYEKKEELLREIVFEGLEQIGRDVLEIFAAKHDPVEKLEAVLRVHLRFNVEHPAESKIIIEESRFLNDVDHALVREKQTAVLNVYRACIRELIASGRIAPVDPTVLAFSMTSIVMGWYRWFRQGGPVDTEDAYEFTVRFAMAAALNVRAVES